MRPDPLSFFIDLPDPRRKIGNQRHKVEGMVMITLCAALGGFEDDAPAGAAQPAVSAEAIAAMDGQQM